MARFDTRQVPIKGQYYTSTDGAQSGLDEGFIYCLQDTVLSAISWADNSDIDPNDRLLTETIPAGVEIHGRITGFTVTSGMILHVRG